jgi:hypothetical protein
MQADLQKMNKDELVTHLLHRTWHSLRERMMLPPIKLSIFAQKLGAAAARTADTRGTVTGRDANRLVCPTLHQP